jgi:hypothetical protein
LNGEEATWGAAPEQLNIGAAMEREHRSAKSQHKHGRK